MKARVNGNVGVKTYWVDVMMSGPMEVAKQLMRRECGRSGLCVTLVPAHYIYTGGEESGYIVRIINYARFPAEPEHIFARAILIADLLMEETHQGSCSVVTPDITFFIRSRKAKE